MEVLSQSLHVSPTSPSKKRSTENEPRPAKHCNSMKDTAAATGARRPPPPAPPARGPSATEAAKQVAGMKEELARVQAREIHLGKMLDQERENTRRAEQLIEVEKIACLELKRQLHLERRKNCKGEELERSLSFSAEDSEREEEMMDDCVSFQYKKLTGK